MNKKLKDAMFSIEKANALMSAVEDAFSDVEYEEYDLPEVNKGAYLFYALWDCINDAKAQLEALSADQRIVDVYTMVRKARTRD